MKKCNRTNAPKIFCLLVFVCLTVVSSAVFANGLKEKEYYVLTILHTNDIHGHVDELPKYATLIKQARAQAKNLLALDGGDLFLRGEFSDLGGIPEMKMLNAIGYDAWVIGNNDFRVPKNGKLPPDDRTLNALVRLANADAVCANVVYKRDGKFIDGVKPYVVKELGGVKVGIVGLTSTKPQDRNYEPDKLFLDAADTLKKAVEELKGKADAIIVLSHCGLSEDVKLSYVPGISAVIGADDHFRMEQPIYWVWKGEKSVPIVQHGGEENGMLGRLDLTFQMQDGALKLVDYQGSAYDTKFVPADQSVQAIIDAYRAEYKKAAAPGNAA